MTTPYIKFRPLNATLATVNISLWYFWSLLALMGTLQFLKTEPDRERNGRREEPEGKKSLLADGRPVPDHSAVTQLSLQGGGV